MKRAGLWLAAFAPFVLVSPLLPEHHRSWESAVFLWGGLTLAALYLSDTLALKSLMMWLCASAVLLHRNPASFQFLMFTIGGLGFYAIARQNTNRNLIRVIAVSMTIAIGLQAVGLYSDIARWIIPSYERVIYNDHRIYTGFTASTGDAGVVLAMAVPYMTEGIWWLFLPGVIAALFATKALSAIVAAMCGLFVVCFPYVATWNRQMKEYSRGLPVLVWTMAVAFLLPMINKVDSFHGAIIDERWKVWWLGLQKWTASLPEFWTGYGLGSWKSTFPMIQVGDKLHHWQQAHFDLLQFGYEAGMVAVLIFAAVVVETMRRAHRIGDTTALGGIAALLVTQFGHFPWHLGVGGVMAVLVFADARRERWAQTV